MAKAVKMNFDSRVVFPKAAQSEFLKEVANRSGLSWALIADKLRNSRRALFDWRREKYLFTFGRLKSMCELANMDFPEEVKIKKPFWSVVKAAKKGGRVTYKRYGRIGDPKLRKKRWQEWWDSKGKFNLNGYFVAKKINTPNKSEKLAEFVGIMIGDGGITKRQVNISLNSVADASYVIFVESLIRNLFKVEPHISKRKMVTNLTVSRTCLVDYCRSIGLLVGNKIKQGVDLPVWIKREPRFMLACIRGLVDTDGCVFWERHHIKDKCYCYPRLSFVSASRRLRLSFYTSLTKLGFTPKIRNDRSVQIEKKDEIDRYFVKIGTNNPKHRDRYMEYSGGVG